MSHQTPDGAAILSFTKTTHHDTYPYISPGGLDYTGRSVFITGASKGIGRQTALSYAAAGCSNIAIGARSDLSGLEQEIKQVASKMGRKVPKVVSMKLDVTVDDNVKAAAEMVTKEFGGVLDVLIANAGYLEQWIPLADSDASEWWRSWEVNVKGAYLCAKYFIPLLLKSETKTCILSSSYGSTLFNVGGSAYEVSKFAIARLSQFISSDYRDQGLVCFAIHPGSLRTELALNMPEYMHSLLVDEPQLTGDAAAWLGKENRPWMSGRFISVHWDMEELEARKDEIVKGNLLTFKMMT
ncbi:hypothetical protein F4775DRAFT_532352 [Biscogniauxia sp. FL1348]|nr:hypothetical protein F4775DRAFT_532352 [Biscogniauxia sp. FL1348]